MLMHEKTCVIPILDKTYGEKGAMNGPWKIMDATGLPPKIWEHVRPAF